MRMVKTVEVLQAVARHSVKTAVCHENQAHFDDQIVLEKITSHYQQGHYSLVVKDVVADGAHFGSDQKQGKSDVGHKKQAQVQTPIALKVQKINGRKKDQEAQLFEFQYCFHRYRCFG
jgi:ribosomal protein S24E